VEHRWRKIRGRLVALRLVVDLEEPTVRITERVRRPVADVAVVPAQPLTRPLEVSHSSLERGLARGSQREMAESRRLGLGELEAVALVVAEAAEVARAGVT